MALVLPVLMVLCLVAAPQCFAQCASVTCFKEEERVNTMLFFDKLKGSLGGPFVERWSKNSFCTWNDTSCTITGVTVNLSNQIVSGSLPDLDDGEINGSQVVVTALFLASTSVAGTLPPSWGALRALRSLDLSHTGVSGILPSEWSVMPNLTTVNVSWTNVSGRLPVSWASLPSLEVFCADSTNIAGGLPRRWAILSRLRMLTLSHTGLSGYLPAVYASLTSLVTLDVGNTSISGTLPPSWGALHNLAYLSASNTSVSGTLPPEWSGMTSLRTLTLVGTQLEGTIPDSWDAMTSLELGAMEDTNVTCCLPYEWLCSHRGVSTGVGLTNPASLACPDRAKVCGASAASSSYRPPSYTTSCPAYRHPSSHKYTEAVFPVWAVLIITLAGAAGVLVFALLLWCWWMHRQGNLAPRSPSSFEKKQCSGAEQQRRRSAAMPTVDREAGVEVPESVQSNPLSASSSSGTSE